jgi:hypothetical protein
LINDREGLLRLDVSLGLRRLPKTIQCRHSPLNPSGNFVQVERLDRISTRLRILGVRSSNLFGPAGQNKTANTYIIEISSSGCSRSLALTSAPERQDSVGGAYSELAVTLLELKTLQQIDALKRGEIDVGFGRL